MIIHKKYQAIIGAILMTFAAHPAFARADGGSHGGNGGDAVVCFNQSIFRSGEPVNPAQGPVVMTSLELLDYYQGRKIIGAPIKIGTSSMRYPEKVDWEIAEIAKTNSELARQMKIHFHGGSIGSNNYGSFWNQTELKPLKEIPQLHDSNYDPVEEPNCYVTQFAFQEQYISSKAIRYTIAKEFMLGTVASEDTKAGLVLHELMLSVVLDNSFADTTDLVRPINYIFASGLQSVLVSTLPTLTDIDMRGVGSKEDGYLSTIFHSISFDLLASVLKMDSGKPKLIPPSKLDFNSCKLYRIGRQIFPNDSDSVIDVMCKTFETNPDDLKIAVFETYIMNIAGPQKQIGTCKIYDDGDVKKVMTARGVVISEAFRKDVAVAPENTLYTTYGVLVPSSFNYDRSDPAFVAVALKLRNQIVEAIQQGQCD